MNRVTLKNNKKFFSLFVSMFVFLNIVFSSIVNAEEIVGVRPKKDSEKVIKDSYEKYLENLNGNKVKVEGESDAYVNPNTEVYKVDPEEKVRVIVEVEKDYLVPSTRINSFIGTNPIARDNIPKKTVKSVNKDICKEKVKKVHNAEIKKSYDEVISGFSADVKYKNVREIENIHGVKHVTIAKKVYPQMNFAKDICNIEKLWKDYKHKGEGMIVSVVDTGVDYTHKDMKISDGVKVKLDKNAVEGKGFKGKYLNRKVPYGYNFADNNFDISDKVNKDHGMHVAGIIGANGDDKDIKNNNAVKGVAPEVQLLAMKVFSNDPNNKGTYMDDIVAAIDESVRLGADVINLSIGSSVGFVDSYDAEQVAIKEAVKKGVIVVASAGNSQYSTGDYKFSDIVDTGIVSSPGLVPEAIQVSSFENNKMALWKFNYSLETESGTGNESGKTFYIPSDIHPENLLKGKHELEGCMWGRENDFIDPTTQKQKDLKGKIALIQRGRDITFEEKVLNAQNAGAAGVILYNDADKPPYLYMKLSDNITIPSVFISKKDGVKLNKALMDRKNPAKIMVDFPGEMTIEDNTSAGDISDFSSWGPTPNLDFKPQVTAPGGNILSTVSNNKYGVKSGTSMSSPYVSALYALMLQNINDMEKKGVCKFTSDLEKKDVVKSLVINSSRVSKDPSSKDGSPFSPRRQGAGVVDGENAMKNLVTARVNNSPNASLKEVNNNEKFEIVLQNYGDKNLTYKIEDLSGVLSDKDAGMEPGKRSKDMTYDVKLKGASITFNKKSISIPKGGKASVQATINLDNTVPKDIFIEGFIGFRPENKENAELVLPYMGFYGVWGSLPIMDTPVYDAKNSRIKGTMLVSKYKNDYIILGRDGALIKSPYNVAFNTVSDYRCNVIPQVSFLRNAKEVNVNVLDKDKNVIRNLSIDNNVRKILLKENRKAYRDDNWMWDGKIYNEKIKKYEDVSDGQYYMQVKSKVDYKGAEFQTIEMPVKKDSLNPELVVYGDKEVLGNKYTIDFTAEDKCSGVDGFTVDVNGYLQRDKYNSSFLKLTPNKEGMYSLELNNLKENEMNKVSVYVIDYAGNTTSATLNLKTSNLIIEDPENGKFIQSGDFTLKYGATKSLMEKADKFKIFVDGKLYGEQLISKEDLKNESKHFNYELKNLGQGAHRVVVVAAKDNPKESIGYDRIDSRFVDISMPLKDLNVLFSNLKSGQLIKTSNYVTKGKVTNKPKMLKIDGSDVNIKDDLTFGHNIKLKEGLNKVPVEIKNDKGKEYSYVLNVYCDLTAPIINLAISDEEKDDIKISVPNNTDTYTLKGTVKDNLYGCSLYANGDAIANIHSIPPIVNKEEKEFKYEVKLKESSTNIELKAVDKAGNVSKKNITIEKEQKVNGGEGLGDGQVKLELISPKKDHKFKLGSNVRVKLKAKNLSNKTKEVCLITALYDENNSMISFNCGEYEIEPNKDIKLNSIFSTPKVGKYKVKCFIWDSLDKKNIISNKYEFVLE
ncbi:S8 family serine peptidase [Hathewaya histolytica]|uniref:Serine protease n=1 Tax=Hathewaya histolytica TaxID=1498 RepID=A0A4V6KC07_HATHI|nr:S8 family serine peptidase [Hathewaya histolytica]VTQ84577.1 serine protease [Hathewaya histolytica]